MKDPLWSQNLPSRLGKVHDHCGQRLRFAIAAAWHPRSAVFQYPKVFRRVQQWQLECQLRDNE
jgi:hypothetical protein